MCKKNSTRIILDKRIINRKIQYQKQSTLLAKLPTNSDESQIKILKYGIKTKDGLNYLVQNTARQFFSSRKTQLGFLEKETAFSKQQVTV